MPLLITIFSDASFREGQSHYGYWYKSTNITDEGAGRKTAHSIEHAELIGLCHATALAVKAHRAAGIEDLALVLQCDNMACLGLLLTIGGGKQASTSPRHIHGRKKWHPDEAALIQELRTGIGEMAIWLKHVKGHTRSRDGRSSINRLTDRLSKGHPSKKKRNPPGNSSGL